MLRYKRANVALLVILFAFTGFDLAISGPPMAGGMLPDFSLPVPVEIQDRKYMGLDDKPTFKVPEIKADVIIIQIFSMY